VIKKNKTFREKLGRQTAKNSQNKKANKNNSMNQSRFNADTFNGCQARKNAICHPFVAEWLKKNASSERSLDFSEFLGPI